MHAHAGTAQIKGPLKAVVYWGNKMKHETLSSFLYMRTQALPKINGPLKAVVYWGDKNTDAHQVGVYNL